MSVTSIISTPNADQEKQSKLPGNIIDLRRSLARNAAENPEENNKQIRRKGKWGTG